MPASLDNKQNKSTAINQYLFSCIRHNWHYQPVGLKSGLSFGSWRLSFGGSGIRPWLVSVWINQSIPTSLRNGAAILVIGSTLRYFGWNITGSGIKARLFDIRSSAETAACPDRLQNASRLGESPKEFRFQNPLSWSSAPDPIPLFQNALSFDGPNRFQNPIIWPSGLLYSVSQDKRRLAGVIWRETSPLLLSFSSSFFCSYLPLLRYSW